MTTPPAPPPVSVAGNQWPDLALAPEKGWVPERPVSIIIPHYRALLELARTLAALDAQEFPSHLAEVVVVDDGSPAPPELPEDFRFPLSLVSQDRRGFGLARARNTGAKAATGEIFVFLDCDMVPDRGWLAAHTRWHHHWSDLVTVGFRAHVDFSGIGCADLRQAAGEGRIGSLLAGRSSKSPAWIERRLERTGGLTTGDDDLFAVLTGGNFGVRAESFWEVGGFDESFTQWGGEDTELGYRLFVNGAVLVPERRAFCWHQGGDPDLEQAEQESLREHRAKMAHLIAEPSFRRRVPGRSYTVPSLLVEVVAGDTEGEAVLATVESILAGRFHDLVVQLFVGEAHPDRRTLEWQFSGDPRVEVLTERDTGRGYPFAPYRAHVTPGTVLGERSISRALDRLADGPGMLEIRTSGGDPVRVVKTRALRRAERLATSPGDVAELVTRLFGRRSVSGRSLGVRRAGTSPELSVGLRHLQQDARAVLRRVAGVRDLHDLAVVWKWIATGLWDRLWRGPGRKRSGQR